jgi:hypothetical protein
LATILHESFGIEPKGRGHVHQKPHSNMLANLFYGVVKLVLMSH